MSSTSNSLRPVMLNMSGDATDKTSLHMVNTLEIPVLKYSNKTQQASMWTAKLPQATPQSEYNSFFDWDSLILRIS